MKQLRDSSHKALVFVEDIGLIIIAIATVIAMGHEIMAMFSNQVITLADLLLMFIYLEVLAMVSIYFESGQLPVRMPLYIAMVALARYMILDMKNLDTWRMLGISASILVVAISVLVLRYGHIKYPYEKKRKAPDQD